jgi:hypothetical protein
MALDPNRTFPSRNDGYQDIIWHRYQFNFNDGGIANGVQFGTLPQGSFIATVLIDNEVVWNAATTNVVTVGTTQASANEIINSIDFNEAATGVTAVARGLGVTLASAGDVGLWVKYTQTGTAATTGRATVVIGFIPPTSH